MINTNDLKRAVAIAEKLEVLRAELGATLDGGVASVPVHPRKAGRQAADLDFGSALAAAPKKRKKRTLSPEALEKIRAAQKRRWAAFHKKQKAGK